MKKRISLIMMIMLIAAVFMALCACGGKADIDGEALSVDSDFYVLGETNYVNEGAISDNNDKNDVGNTGNTDTGNSDAGTDDTFTELKEGDENYTVEEIQNRLIELNYLHAEATGYYGTVTAEAVKSFQEANNLEATGIVDEQTYSVLFSEDAVACELPLVGIVIGIDPGYQSEPNSEMEPIAPDSSEMQEKMSYGAVGAWTETPEYDINLSVALLLRELLEEQGATVILTRETNDVDISNAERAEIFNNNETNLAIVLQCNSAEDMDINGALMLVPEESEHLRNCKRAADIIIESFCSETGADNLGVQSRDDMACFNWCERMILGIRMGYLSNKDEEAKLTDREHHDKMAKGIFNGIMTYLG